MHMPGSIIFWCKITTCNSRFKIFLGKFPVMKADKHQKSKGLSFFDSSYERKVLCLRRKCEQLEVKNERLLHRLHKVHKMLKQYKSDRRFLIQKLDLLGDNYRETQEALPYEAQEGNQGMRQQIEQFALRKSNPSATESQPVTRRKVKAEPKDPNAPKKPVNAYVMFFQHKRHSVQENYFKEHKHDIGNHELTRIIGHQWNNLSQPDKQVFYDLYEKEKEKYQLQLSLYEQSKEAVP